MAYLRETINIVAFNIFQSGLESDWSVIQIEVEPNHFISFSLWPKRRQWSIYIQMGMDQYLLIPFLGGWTSIYQLFWGSLGTRVLTHPQISIEKTCRSIQFHRTALVFCAATDQEVPAATGEMGHGMSADQDPWSSAREHEFRDIEDDMVV